MNQAKTKAKWIEQRKMEKTCQRKKIDTIENPHSNHTIGDQGCSWTTPLKNCQSAMFW